MQRPTTGAVCGVLGAGLLVCSLVGCSLIFPFNTTATEDDVGLGDTITPADASVSEGSAPSDASTPVDTDAGPAPDTSTTNSDSGLCSLSCSTGWCPMKGPTNTKKLYGIWGQSLHELWAVGEKLTVLRVDPTSCAWVPWPINKDLGPTLYSKLSGITLWGVWGSSAGNVFAVGENGTILRFDGTKWGLEIAASGTKDLLRAVGGSATHVFAVGHNAQILRREAAGVWKSWTPMTSNALTGISGKVPGTTPGGSWAYYAVGVGGSFHYHDGATSTTFTDVAGWKASCTSAQNWQAVWGAPSPVAGKPEVVLVGQGGAVLRFYRASSGAAPSCVLDTLGSKVHEAVDGRNADDIWIVGEAGSVYRRAGTTWVSAPLPSSYSSTKLRGVWVAKSGVKLVIAVSEAKTILFKLY